MVARLRSTRCHFPSATKVKRNPSALQHVAKTKMTRPPPLKRTEPREVCHAIGWNLEPRLQQNDTHKGKGCSYLQVISCQPSWRPVDCRALGATPIFLSRVVRGEATLNLQQFSNCPVINQNYKRGETFREAAMHSKDTVEFLRSILDEAWMSLTPRQKMSFAGRIWPPLFWKRLREGNVIRQNLSSLRLAREKLSLKLRSGNCARCE